MRKNPLQLEYYFFPKTSVSAHPLDQNAQSPMSDPQVRALALIEDGGLHANLTLDWGDAKSRYEIHVMAFGSFKLTDEHLKDLLHVGRVANNAATLLVSAMREHISSVTARAPHSEEFLPLLTIEDRDIEIRMSDELADRLGLPVADSEEQAPKKRKRKKA